MLKSTGMGAVSVKSACKRCRIHKIALAKTTESKSACSYSVLHSILLH